MPKLNIRYFIIESILAAVMFLGLIKGTAAQIQWLDTSIFYPPIYNAFRSIAFPLIAGLLVFLMAFTLPFMSVLKPQVFMIYWIYFVCKVLVVIKEIMYSKFVVQNHLQLIGGNFLILTMLYFLPFAYKSVKDAILSMCRALIYANLVFLAISIYFFTINPLTVFWAGRFQGLAAHPIFAAAAITLGTIAAISLGILTERLHEKVLFFTLAILFGLALYFTGSRSGFVSFSFAMVPLLIRKPKYFFFSAAILFGATVMSSLLTQNIPLLEFFASDRILSTDDTRSEVWGKLYEGFLRHPLFGPPTLRTPSENAFLLYLNRTGLIGLPSFIALVLGIFGIYLGIFNRAYTFQKKIDLSVMLLCLLNFFIVFSVFEGYWWDTISLHFAFFVCTLGLCNRALLEKTQSRSQ